MSRTTKPRRSAPPWRLEILETRTLLSVSATPAGASASRLLVQFASATAGAVAVVGPFATGVRPLGGGLFTVDLAPGVSPADAAARYAALPGVKYAEPDRMVSISAVPNDPQYPQQYALAAANPNGIDATTAWDVTTGSANVVEAVTDTGTDYTHPDLYLSIAIDQGEIPPAIKAKLVETDGDNIIDFHDLNSLDAAGKPVLDSTGARVNAGATHDGNGNGYIDGGDLLKDPVWNDGVDKDHNGYAADLIGWNFVTNTNDPMDDHYHGTFVSGIIGAATNNGVGVAGVDWHAEILPVKFLDKTGNGSNDAAIQAIRYAAQRGAKVINASWGYQPAAGDTDQATSDAITYAGTLGSVFVAAAGNNGVNNDASPFYPATHHLSNELVVAATDSTGALASFSNYGATTVDIGAPGVNITSTTPNAGYSAGSGTSFAAPYTTGVVGLLAAQFPSWTPQQYVQRIIATAKPLASLAGKTVSGGLLSAYSALIGLSPTPSNGPVAHWSFDENAGATAHDSAGTDDATLIGGPVWASGRLGSALSFPAGASSHVEAPDESALTFHGSQSSYTLTAWVNATDIPASGWHGVVTKGRDSSGWYGVWIANGQWVAGSPSGNLFGSQVTPGWHNVAIVQDGLAGTRALYVDGVSVATGASADAGGPGKFWVGGAAGVNEFFTGSVDDVQVSARALSAAELVSLANPSTSIPPAAPSFLIAQAVSTTQINLSWTDRSDNETGFAIERSTDGSVYTAAGQVGPNVTAFQDKPLTSAFTYYYRVRAVNSAGASDPSNVASARTQSAPGLVARWAFDEGTGTTAKDSAGTDDAALVGSVAWVIGHSGTAVNFPAGAASHVEAPDESALTFHGSQTSYTLAAWVNAADIPASGWHGVVTKGRDSSGWYGVWIANGQWVAGSPNGNLIGSQVKSGWHNVAIVQDGVAGTRALYVDGVSVATGASADAGGPGKFWIGGAAGVSEFFTGSVDDVRVYGRALTASELTDPGTSTPPAAPSSLSASAASSTQINLAWLVSAGDATGFKIFRSADGVNFTQVGTALAADRSYQDRGLTSGQVYQYRVRATNSAGDSPDSNTATARPQAAAGLVANWAFTDNTGTIALDSAGTDNATLVGAATWAVGRPGSAASVGFPNGLNGHAEAADESALSFHGSQTSYTLTAWVNAADIPASGWHGVVTKGRDSSGWYGVWIANGQWVAGAPSGNLFGSQVTSGWHNVAIVQDGVASTRALFVDGVSVATGASADAGGPGKFWVGGAAGVSEFFAGSVNDVRVYSRALSTSELGAIASS